MTEIHSRALLISEGPIFWSLDKVPNVLQCELLHVAE